MRSDFYEYCEECGKRTLWVPIASFNHGYSSEDIDLDGYVCEKCYTNPKNHENKED